MGIAQAIVLAGNCRGSDPWPSLGLTARQLAPVANKPVLFHHLDALAEAGVRRALVVTDDTTRVSIPAALGDGSAWGLAISYLDGAPSALASPVVDDFAGAGPVLVQHGDVLVRDRLDGLCAHFADAGLDALVLRPGGDDDASRSERSWAAAGGPVGFIVGGTALGVLAETLDGSSGALLGRLGKAGAHIQERVVDACVPCRGRVEELLHANRCMLEDLVPDGQGERVVGSELQGRVTVHPSAEVHDSLIRGPVVIGAGTCIDSAYVGPYTSIGADVQLNAVEIEHSIVLDGARIRFVGARIEGSLVGPGAQIERDFRVPQAVRLWVGASAEVALA